MNIWSSQDIAAAYEALSDEETRKKYDKFGEDGLNKGQTHDASDIFNKYGSAIIFRFLAPIQDLFLSILSLPDALISSVCHPHPHPHPGVVQYVWGI
jgi:DnaJ-class molecular chaperone